MQTATTPTTQRKSGWTPARRARHALLMRRWKPWARSTGPRTAQGKARAALNAFKHGRHADPLKGYARLLKDHSAFLGNLLRASKLAREYAYYARPGCAVALQKLITSKGLDGHKKMDENELLALAVRRRLLTFPKRRKYCIPPWQLL